MLPLSEGEFQRGHTVGSHRQRPLHGLSGLLLERAERHGRRTAGREVQSHSLFLVRHGTQTDNHLVVFPRGFQHGDVHGTVVYRHNGLHVRVLVRSDMHQRLRLLQTETVGGHGVISAMRMDAVTESHRPVLRQGEIRVPMVIHRPGIHRGRRFQLGQPRPLSAPSQRNVGRAVAILKQGGIQGTPSHAVRVVRNVQPTLQGYPVAVGLRPLVFLHFHHAPRDVHFRHTLRHVETETEMYAVFVQQR